MYRLPFSPEGTQVACLTPLHVIIITLWGRSGCSYMFSQWIKEKLSDWDHTYYRCMQYHLVAKWIDSGLKLLSSMCDWSPCGLFRLEKWHERKSLTCTLLSHCPKWHLFQAHGKNNWYNVCERLWTLRKVIKNVFCNLKEWLEGQFCIHFAEAKEVWVWSVPRKEIWGIPFMPAQLQSWKAGRI